MNSRSKLLIELAKAKALFKEPEQFSSRESSTRCSPCPSIPSEIECFADRSDYDDIDSSSDSEKLYSILTAVPVSTESIREDASSGLIFEHLEDNRNFENVDRIEEELVDDPGEPQADIEPIERELDVSSEVCLVGNRGLRDEHLEDDRNFENVERIEEELIDDPGEPQADDEPINERLDIGPAVSMVEKRKRNERRKPETWKKNVRKRKRNLGLEYVKTTGRIEAAKEMKEPCGARCPLKCWEKLNNDKRAELFTAFWQLGNAEKQRDYISRFVKQQDKRRSSGLNSRRKFTVFYNLSHEGKEQIVCKIFFLNTLGISEKKVRVALAKESRSVNAVPSPEKRGRHSPSNKSSEDRIKHMEAHIDSFPRVPAHWCRAGTSREREYLEPILNKEKMYDLYVDHCRSANVNPLGKTLYKEKMIEKNISFHTPKKDRCWCYNYETLEEPQKTNRKEEYELHTKRKDAVSTEKEEDKKTAIKDKTTLTANFDLEAVLYCPLEFGKPIFYKRKFAVFNFTIYEVAEKKGHCFMWNENQGKRGANEIATCLQKFILNLSPHVKTLILYSDCCGGQNRNSILPMMFLRTLNRHPTLERIFMKFLEPGHTHMECDSMHSCIEKAAESAQVHSPDDWRNIIRLAKRGPKKYAVNELQPTDFTYFKKFRDDFVLNLSKGVDGTILNWKDVKCLYFQKNMNDAFFFKQEHWEENFHKLDLTNVSTRTRKRVSSKYFVNIKECGDPQPAYNGELPIKRAKYNDLQFLCRTHVIPPKFHSSFSFYCTLNLCFNNYS